MATLWQILDHLFITGNKGGVLGAVHLLLVSTLWHDLGHYDLALTRQVTGVLTWVAFRTFLAACLLASISLVVRIFGVTHQPAGVTTRQSVFTWFQAAIFGKVLG